MKLGISIILFLIAFFVSPVINLMGLIFSVIYISTNRRFIGNKKAIFSAYFGNHALSKDQHGNASNWHFFNVAMLKKSKIKLLEGKSNETGLDDFVVSFGNPDETISYVLGKNRNLKALNLHGRFWAWFLNLIDKGHTDEAVKLQENE